VANPLHKVQGPSSPTRNVGSWASSLFEARLSASAALNSQTGKLGSAYASSLVENAATGSEAARERSRAHDLSRAGMCEIFSRLYSFKEPAVLDTPAAGSKIVQQSHSLLDGMEEFSRLRQQVVGDPDLAALAAAKLAEAISKQLPKATENEARKERQRKRDLAQSLGLPVPPSNEPKQQAGDTEAAVKLAMRQAAQDAAEEVANVRAGLGNIPGMAGVPQSHEQHDTRRMQLAERLAKDSLMERVMQVAGRLRRVNSATRKVKSRKSVGSVVGVTTGKDISLMLGAERAMMRNPVFRQRQIMKLVQSQMQQYELEGKENQGRGPMILLLDTSGSMGGDPIMWASAVAITLSSISAKERRPYTVITFNGQVGTVLRLDASGKLFRLDRRDPAKKTPLEGGIVEMVLRIAGFRASGGTAFSQPVRYALDMELGVTKERADLVIVTDGGSSETRLPQEELQRLQQAKESGLRVFGLTVNGGSFSKQVREICDEYADIDKQQEKAGAALPTR